MTPIGERALVAWPLLVAETLIFGTTAFALVLAPNTQSEEVASPLTPLWRGLALMAVVFSPLALLVGTANMGDVSLRAAFALLPQVIRETHFGRVWSWGFPLIGALLAITWTRGSGPLKTAALGLAACALFCSEAFPAMRSIGEESLSSSISSTKLQRLCGSEQSSDCGLGQDAASLDLSGYNGPRHASRAWRDGQ